ncbi:MAG: hypothetical protein WCG26_01375, partial [Chloroflexales bacterium]
MPRQAHRRLLLLVVVTLLTLIQPAPQPLSATPVAPTLPTNVPALPTSAAPVPAVTGLPPLPRTCIGGAPLDSFAQALCCVS